MRLRLITIGKQSDNYYLKSLFKEIVSWPTEFLALLVLQSNWEGKKKRAQPIIFPDMKWSPNLASNLPCLSHPNEHHLH